MLFFKRNISRPVSYTHLDVYKRQLLDRPYKESNTDQELKEYLRCLSDKGPEVVIITSVPVLDEPHKLSLIHI